MADYLGTVGDDDLDQSKLKLSDWSGTIRGLAGNDKITGGNIHMQGGPGNDTIVGTTSSSTVNYYDSPKGIKANLKTGLVEDGWGTVDTLINIHVIHGSSYSDNIIGSDDTDNIWVGAGDVVDGGGGIDTVTIWDDSTNWKISKLSTTEAKLVQINSGQIVECKNVEKIQFKDVTSNLEFDQKLVFKDNQPSLIPGQFITTYSTDLNADGLWDIVVCGGTGPPSPNVETAPQVLTQNADGSFRKASFTGTLEGFVHPREIASGDFNGDGIKDLVIVGHGWDTSPFTGETPTVLLGQIGGGFKDISELLPQTPAFTHSVAVADVNLDGLDDLFLGNIWGQQQFVPQFLISNKSGGFTNFTLPKSIGADALIETGTLPVASMLKDLNGDGFIDLVAGGGSNGVFIYKGQLNKSTDTNSSFFDSNRQALPVGTFGLNNTNTIDIQTIDVNRDGLKDLLLSQTSLTYGGRSIQVLIQTREGNWIDETNSRIHGLNKNDDWIAFLNLVDLNQDGHLDILATGSSNTQTAAWVDDGSGNYYPASSSNGVPNVSGTTLLPAEAGKLFSVENSTSGLMSISSISLYKGFTGPNMTQPSAKGAPGFNEQYYLNHNPVVVEQISKKIYTSGLESYLSEGRLQGKRAFAEGTNVWGSNLIDTVFYGGSKVNYQVTKTLDSTWQVATNVVSLPKDKLFDIERIQFSDKALSLDVNGNAGTTAKILGAVFGKESVSNNSYVGIGLNFLDAGWTYDNLAGLALNAAGAKTNDQIVSLLWTNVIGTKPTAADKQPFITLLENGMTAGALAHLAADTSFNTTNINLVGLAQTGIEYIPVS
jgi:hypothetical protein